MNKYVLFVLLISSFLFSQDQLHVGEIEIYGNNELENKELLRTFKGDYSHWKNDNVKFHSLDVFDNTLAEKLVDAWIKRDLIKLKSEELPKNREDSHNIQKQFHAVLKKKTVDLFGIVPRPPSPKFI